MDLFRSGLKTILGSQEAGTQPTGAETVEHLVNRVRSSTLLEDRRDACRALKSLSKKYRLEVGAHGMEALKQTLEIDRADCEIVSYCLEALCNITASDFDPDNDNELNMNPTANVGEQFTEMFIKNRENVTLILGYMEEYDFRVRWPAVKLLKNLLVNKPKDIQDIILVSPMGVSKLMDLLLDNREVIRNDALLLLIHLTKSNANIQKIVAFENAFDRVFEVVKGEGYNDGSIVVEDCLLLMLNLLKNNTSNIIFFNEGSYIQRLAPMLKLPDGNEGTELSPQKASNIHCVLQLIRALVSPSYPVNVVTACQKSLRNAGVLEILSNMLLASGIPADILTEAINTVGEVIRGNLPNQEYFAGVVAPANPPKPIITLLLMSMVNEKQPFALRTSILYCFLCFVFKNEIVQAMIIQTLLPDENNMKTVSIGQILCNGLFSTDSISNWFCSVALMHTIIDNPAHKELLLKVLIATEVGAQPESLLTQCAKYLQKTTMLQTKLGLLMLLSMWVSYFPPGIQMLIKTPGAMAYLTAQTSAIEHGVNEELVQSCCAFIMGSCILYNDNSVENYNRENLKQLLQKRVGMDMYNSKLNEISRHEVYSKAAKQPQIKAKNSSELLLEFEFCKLYKSLECLITNNLLGQNDVNGELSELTLNDKDNSILLQYKELIREQDRRLQVLQKQVDVLTSEKNKIQEDYNDLKVSYGQLQDQMIIYKARLNSNSNEIPNGIAIEQQVVANNVENMTTSNNDSQIADVRIKELQAENVEKEEELTRLRQDQENLLVLLLDQDQKLAWFKQRLREMGENIEDDSNEEDEELINT